MNVLFVCSSNRFGDCSPIVTSQAESLKKEGVEIDYFRIKGKGVRGYAMNIPRLRKYIRMNPADIIHAHYWLSGLVASFSGRVPLVVSLMGSDLSRQNIIRRIIRRLNHSYWGACIVKSGRMKYILGKGEAHVIPNGVDLELFHPLEKEACREKLSWAPGKIHILFPADPSRLEKNYTLLNQALVRTDWEYEVHFFQNIPHIETVFHYNAADIVVMTSLWEGSPNAIKEAMACNCTTISTDVGDVAELFKDTDGYYITEFDAVDLVCKMEMALKFKGKANGRESIKRLELDSESIAQRIIALYNQLTNEIPINNIN